MEVHHPYTEIDDEFIRILHTLVLGGEISDEIETSLKSIIGIIKKAYYRQVLYTAKIIRGIIKTIYEKDI